MPPDREVLPDRPEAREKFLRAFRVAKAAHATLTFTRWLVAVLCAVVQSCGRFDEHVLHVRKVPRATRFASRRFYTVSKALAKFVAPAPDGFVCYGHAALEEQFLYVAQAQLKAEIPTHGATDDPGWETVTVIERFRFLHHVILRDRAGNLTTPARCEHTPLT